MSDQDAHVPTDQETALYDALTVGDHDAIEQMRGDAYGADQAPPDPVPENWVTPAARFDSDHERARAHYQADHEIPEDQREQATAEQVQTENDAAPEPESEPQPENNGKTQA